MTYSVVKSLLTLVFVALFLTGCVGLSKERVLTPIDGYLHTSKGKYQFKKGIDKLTARIPRLPSLIELELYAEDDSVLVRLKPISAAFFLEIYSLHENEDIQVDYINSSYQIDDDKPRQIPFLGIADPNYSSKRKGHIYVDSQPAYVKSFGRSFKDWKGSGLEVGTQIKYRIPFSVGDEEYLIDVATKYKNSYRPEILVPGPSSP